MNRTCVLVVLLCVSIAGACVDAFAETLSAETTTNQVSSDVVVINGDTPWVVMSADFQNPAIQEAIRDAERDWYKVFGYPPVVFKDDTRRAWTGPVVAFGSAENTGKLFASEVPKGAEQ